MNLLHFSIDIQASSSKIWASLWEDQYYRDWAGVFFEGSYMVVENWDVGSKVLFLGPDHSGIYSKIESHILEEKIVFKHIGNVQNGKEQPLDEDSKKWSGANETYAVQVSGDGCTLAVNLDVMDEHVEFMTTTFPKALEKIKENAETGG